MNSVPLLLIWYRGENAGLRRTAGDNSLATVWIDAEGQD